MLSQSSCRCLDGVVHVDHIEKIVCNDHLFGEISAPHGPVTQRPFLLTARLPNVGDQLMEAFANRAVTAARPQVHHHHWPRPVWGSEALLRHRALLIPARGQGVGGAELNRVQRLQAAHSPPGVYGSGSAPSMDSGLIIPSALLRTAPSMGVVSWLDLNPQQGQALAVLALAMLPVALLWWAWLRLLQPLRR